MPIRRAELVRIGYDPKYYPRVNGREDWLTVHRYKEALVSDPSLAFGWKPNHPKGGFPPVVIVEATGKSYQYLVLDGLHRLRAFHAAGYEEIPAEVERLPESKWFARSVELNVVSKRGLDTGDKAWIAKRLEDDGHTIEEVARLLQMRPESLEKIKAEHIVKIRAGAAKKLTEGRGCRRIGDRSYGFLKSPFTDFAGLANAEQVLILQTRVAARDVVQILDQAIAALEAGVDTADEEVATRLVRLRALCS